MLAFQQRIIYGGGVKSANSSKVTISRRVRYGVMPALISPTIDDFLAGTLYICKALHVSNICLPCCTSLPFYAWLRAPHLDFYGKPLLASLLPCCSRWRSLTVDVFVSLVHLLNVCRGTRGGIGELNINVMTLADKCRYYTYDNTTLVALVFTPNISVLSVTAALFFGVIGTLPIHFQIVTI